MARWIVSRECAEGLQASVSAAIAHSISLRRARERSCAIRSLPISVGGGEVGGREVFPHFALLSLNAVGDGIQFGIRRKLTPSQPVAGDVTVHADDAAAPDAR